MAEEEDDVQGVIGVALSNLQDQINSHKDEIATLKQATSDLQYDLRMGIASMQATSESQYKQIDTKFDMLSSVLNKMEVSQSSLATMVQQQMGAEAERARIRKENLDATHQKAEEASIEAEKAKVELQKYHLRTIRNRWALWIIFMILSLVLGTAIKSAPVTMTLEAYLHAFNHKEQVKVITSPAPKPSNPVKHDNPNGIPFLPAEEKHNLRGYTKDAKQSD